MYSFQEIIGNRFIIDSMQSAVKKGRVSHAYIIDGAEGTGKKLLGGAFAKTLQCEMKGPEPCGRCVSCRTFDDRNHPDVFYVAPTKTTIGVDDIRDQVNAHLKIKPYHYDYKIFMIDKADTMTVAAQNALLKNIEEPPPYGVFLLLSNNLNNFLPTILSRCVVYKMKPLALKEIKAYLLENGTDSEMADMVAAYAGGSIGQALKLLEDEAFLTCRNEILHDIQNIGNNDIAGAFQMVKALEKYKDNITEVLNIIYLFYRDALIYKSTRNTQWIMGLDKMEDIIRFSERQPVQALLNGTEAVLETRRALKYNANFQMALEVMFLKMTVADF